MAFKKSEKGLHFNGEKLNKNNLHMGATVEYKNKNYCVTVIDETNVVISDALMTFNVKYSELSVIQELKPYNDSLNIQVGGNHYKNFAIQPVEFTFKNNLNFLQGNVIKYVCRYKNANGKEDLEKAKHYIDLLIEFEYPNDSVKIEPETWVPKIR